MPKPPPSKPQSPAELKVKEIEIVEDFTSSARCDEGFLHVRRFRARNRREDGSASPIYRIDVIDRPKLDAVAVLVWRRSARRDGGPVEQFGPTATTGTQASDAPESTSARATDSGPGRAGDASSGPSAGGIEVLTRQNLRPAAYFRKDRTPTVPDGRSHLFCEEIVAGLLEPSDSGEDGLRFRAAEEVKEEAGFEVKPAEVVLLGAPFFVAPGIVSEKIFLCAVEVTGREQGVPQGDGSPLEEGGVTRWRRIDELLAACERGEIQDAKTELAARRLLTRVS